MLIRLVLAFVLAVPPFVGLLARSLESEQTFTIVVKMTSSTLGLLEVFPDVGGGYHASLAVQSVTQPTDTAVEHRLPLRVGSYRSLRIDPGIGAGIFGIESIEILDPGGDLYASLPLTELTAAYHLQVIEQSAAKAVFECPVGVADPQIIYTPDRPLILMPSIKTVAELLKWLTFYVAIAFAATWAVGRALARFAPALSRRLESVRRSGALHPQVTLLVAALIATLLAMYPLIFFGRSLVSPNNGGTVMLFSIPPFTPLASDVEIEDVRGNDVGAMMWAFVPYSAMQRQALSDGEWPLWNRYDGPGVSLWGQGQTFLLDPAHWLTLLGTDPAPGWDLKFAAHRAMFAWGIGVASLAATGAVLPAALAAITAPFIGFFAFRFNHPAAFAVTYAPWVIAGWFLLARATTNRRRAGAAVLVALSSALVLLSTPPKEGTMMLLLAEAIGFGALVLQVGASSRLVRPLAFGCVAGLTALLLTTPHWLVFLDTLRESYTHYDNPAAYFASIGFIRALFLGTLLEGPPLPALHTVSVVLLVAAALSPKRLFGNPLLLAAALGAAAAIAIAMGIIPESWMVKMPLLANVHSFHVTFLSAAIVPLLIVSAAGAASLFEASLARVIVVTLATLAVGIWTLNGAALMAGLGRFQGWLAIGALLGAAVVPVTLFVLRRRFPEVVPVSAAVALMCLLLAPGGQHLETGIAPLDKVLVQPRPRHALTAPSPTTSAILNRSIDPSRTMGVGQTLIAGSQALYGLEGIGGPDALIQRSQTDLLLAPGDLIREGWRFLLLPDKLADDAPLLDLLNVGYLMAPYYDAASLGTPLPITELDFVRAVERPSRWPRAFFVDQVATYTQPSDLLAQVRRAGHPIASIQTGDGEAATLTSGLSGPGKVVAADQYVLTTNTTQFHLRTSGQGIAVLSESYLPDDFIATLNDQNVDYFRVNHAFKALIIPGPGDWTIRFTYRPKHWTLALGAAAAGALLLAGMTVVALRR